MLDSGCMMLDDQEMAEEWIVRVQGKEYGPADLATLREWKAEGRVLPNNPARPRDIDAWQTAGEIPGLFEIERPPVQQLPLPRPEPKSKPPSRNILIETFRIYFWGFFQFFCLTLLSIVPILCAEFARRFIGSAPGVNADLRTLVAWAFGMCMLVLRLVLIPVYIAGIQILTAELATGHRIGFLGVLNGAVKYWPRVAGLGIFVYVIFLLLGLFAVGLLVLAATAKTVSSAVLVLALLAFQVWLFARFFATVLFWQQFAVLENLNAFDSLRESRKLARSGRGLPWYQRPLWRGGLIVSIWLAFLIAITFVALWPKFTVEWSLFQDAFNQLSVAQDPQAVLQKLSASLPKEQVASLYELGLNILQRILQPLFGIALVVLYLDSKIHLE